MLQPGLLHRLHGRDRRKKREPRLLGASHRLCLARALRRARLPRCLLVHVTVKSGLSARLQRYYPTHQRPNRDETEQSHLRGPRRRSPSCARSAHPVHPRHYSARPPSTTAFGATSGPDIHDYGRKIPRIGRPSAHGGIPHLSSTDRLPPIPTSRRVRLRRPPSSLGSSP